MDRGFFLFFGCLLTFTSAWGGLVLAPHLQLGDDSVAATDAGTAATPAPNREEEHGRAIYKANGCIYCHSQQVRSGTFGNNADVARGWGTRRSVPRDYLNDQPILLGTMRTGPDLANVGRRWSADWQHKHLYNPRMMTPGSIMPPFPFLFEVKPVGDRLSPDALVLTGTWAGTIPAGHELIPTADAKALVAYLLSLDQSADLPEARE